MKPGGVFLILFVLAIIAGIVVWAISRAQRLFRAQYAAMILVAKARGFRFLNDTDPDVRIRMEGDVEGISVQVRTRMLRLARHTEPTLEVIASGARALPKGVIIKNTGVIGTSLVAEGEGAAPVTEMLQHREFRRAMEAVTETVWAGSPGEGRMDHDGVQLQKGGYQGDPEVINEMISRAVRAYKCYEDLIEP
jgi:hypothetical protein